ncbi:MAG: HlyD family secretion protein [Phyllobacteriaceae bacterium]|nr:HlyD family secretion protein [Phyllobacteriaceae bacterium]
MLARFLSGLGRVVPTVVVGAAAAVVGSLTWSYYMDAPWTRDGRIRADVVGVAPEVSGRVEAVLVADDQRVAAGDVLFRIDASRFELALRQATAAADGADAALAQAGRDLDRYRRLGDATVTRQKREEVETAAVQAEAAARRAHADLDLARLDLDRAQVRAPVAGIVTNLDLRPGTWVAAGKPATALVDVASFHVDGYFEETKLRHIRVGDHAVVRPMGSSETLDGHVAGIAAAIEDRERSASTGLVANINPTFSWVRLAQRVPVRIALDDVPADVHLVAGRTVTVTVRADPR